jgi:hypothetical protein
MEVGMDFLEIIFRGLFTKIYKSTLRGKKQIMVVGCSVLRKYEEKSSISMEFACEIGCRIN